MVVVGARELGPQSINIAAPAPHRVHLPPQAAHATHSQCSAHYPRSWTNNLRLLVQTAASERDTASAIFSEPHDEAAFASVAGGAVDRLVSTGRAIVTARRTGDKVSAAHRR